MVTFNDLPIEIHQSIIECCHMNGEGTLRKYSRLTRWTHSMVYPMMIKSADLTQMDTSNETPFQMFIHFFAPLHRQTISSLSLSIPSRTNKVNNAMPHYCLLDQPLDQLYADILSLLPSIEALALLVATTHETPGEAADSSDYSLTLSAISRLRRLESIRLSGSNPISDLRLLHKTAPTGGRPTPSSHEFVHFFLTSLLPQLQPSLRQLNFEELNLIVGAKWLTNLSMPAITQISIKRCSLSLDSSLPNWLHPLAIFFQPFRSTVKNFSLIDTYINSEAHSYNDVGKIQSETLKILSIRLINHLEDQDTKKDELCKILDNFDRNCSIEFVKIWGLRNFEEEELSLEKLRKDIFRRFEYLQQVSFQ